MLTNNIRGGAILLSVIAALFFLGSDRAAQAITSDITVNTTSDAVDFDGLQQVSDLPGLDGLVSLREAIIAANNTAGPQVIGFNIPTSDAGFDGMVFTIRPLLSILPTLGDGGTTINGATQASFTGNTNPAGPEVVISGSLLVSDDPVGIDIQSANNVLHSLVINRFATTPGGPGNGINIDGSQATGNIVTGCFVGIDGNGTAIGGNGRDGIHVVNGATNNRIGGLTTAERNIISGNGLNGISMQVGANGNIVQGNYVGTDVTGTLALGNGRDGVGTDTAFNIIGGPTLAARNVISGNLRSGVFLVGGSQIADHNLVQGNVIGMDVTGTVPLGNQERGVSVVSNIGTNVRNNWIISNLISANAGEGVGIFSSDGNLVRDNLIGTDLHGNPSFGNGRFGVTIQEGPGAAVSNDNRVVGNVIGGNAFSGVLINAGLRNSINRNRIFSNGELGIRLGIGAGANDPGDFDTGPNELMNFPVLEEAKATPRRLIVTGTIDTQNPRKVTIEFFANPVPTPGGDPSGHGEGAIFLGTARPNPHGEFTATLPRVSAGTIITATATDAVGNTSEFAANIAASVP